MSGSRLGIERPRIGITLGDPTGVGPEVIVGALQSGRLQQECIPVVIGRVAILRRAAELLNARVDIQIHSDLGKACEASEHSSGAQRVTIACLETGAEEVEGLLDSGQSPIDPRAGQAAYDYLLRAAELCLSGQLHAIVTAPLHKTSLQHAGHEWPGHTELLAHLCGARESAMMLYLPPGAPRHGGPAGLGVVHVTLHCALREVFDQMTVPNIVQKIQLAGEFFQGLRLAMGLPPEPRIAVAALNPHAGEHGRFGDEEMRTIGPAVAEAAELGWNVVGPLPVDTLMPAAAEGVYDAVVAMYHDQGHIALKLLDMFEAVNITLGLPILRTSVAHGTAHDIAWQGIAKPGGMQQAILAAARLARTQRLAIRVP